MNQFQPHDPDAYHERLMVMALEMLKPQIARRLAMVKRKQSVAPLGRSVLGDLCANALVAETSTCLLNSTMKHVRLSQALEDVLVALLHNSGAFHKTAQALYKQRHKLDVMLQSPPPAMPPPKPRKKRPKLPLVAQRAVTASARLREWKKKQRVAATKVKAYQKKVAYYNKKGTVDDNSNG